MTQRLLILLRINGPLTMSYSLSMAIYVEITVYMSVQYLHSNMYHLMKFAFHINVCVNSI